MKLKLVIGGLLACLFAGSSCYGGWAAANTAEEIALSSCFTIPSAREMEAQLRRLYHIRPYQRTKYSFDLDGFFLNDKHDQIQDLNALTSCNRFHLHDPDKTVTDEEFEQRRKVRREDSDDIHYNRTYDLSQFQEADPNCRDILCAVKDIFGDIGTELLWAYRFEHINLSRYQSPKAIDFSKEDLDAAIKAQMALPVPLKYHEEWWPGKDGFFRYFHGLKGTQGDLNEGVDGYGGIFDEFDTESIPQRTYIFIHEVGHRAALLGTWRANDPTLYWDETKDWLTLTGWINQFQPGYKIIPADTHPIGGSVSRYASTRPNEDFAETFAAYRFVPDKLKRVSPARYEYMKEHIYRGIEYSQKDICHAIYPANQTYELQARNQ